MAHISSIGANVFSDLAIAFPATDLTPAAIAALSSPASFQALFATEIESIGGTKAANTFVRIKDVREFPAIGTPPNIVNVPVFGSKTSQQVQGQADAPNMEVTVNFVAANWAKTSSLLGDAVGDGVQRCFRFVLMNSEPTLTTNAKYASTAAGIGSVQNSQWYWVGKIDSLLVNPSLSDAGTATISMTLQSAMFGAFTV